MAVNPDLLVTSLEQDPVDGQVLTLHGTTSGNPTSGTVTVPAAAVDPADAVDTIMALTLGTGTFTVSVPLGAGRYDVAQVVLANDAGTSVPAPGTAPVTILPFDGNPIALNPGVPDPVKPSASLIQDALDGQRLTIHGVTRGNPTSASALVPSLDGGTNVLMDIVLGDGTYTATAWLPPGEFGPAQLLFENVAGVTGPIAGTRAVTVLPIGGNPVANNPGVPDPTPAPTPAPTPPPTPAPTQPPATIPVFNDRLWSEEVGMADPSANFNAPPVLAYCFGGRTFVTDINSTLYAPRDPLDESEGEIPRGA